MVLLLLLFSACGLLGINVSKTYTAKHNFYKDVLLFCKNLKNDISFLKTDLVSVLSNNNYKSNFSAILADVSLLLTNNLLTDKTQIIKVIAKHNFLTENDINFLTEIFYNLGMLGYNEELCKIEYSINNAQSFVEDYEKNNLKYAALSKKMGFLTGILVCIVLI